MGAPTNRTSPYPIRSLDPALASATLDWLLHFSTTLNIRGQSYRLRDKCKAGVFHDLSEPQKEA